MRSIYLFSVFFVLSMVGYSQESLQLFYQNKKAGYKNQAGAVIVPPKYDAGSQFVNGFAVVMLNGLRGFINADGTEIIPLH
ncbi:MAG: WG repeat-containing protein, partial [Chitinophagaceae bacterium]|nr:WG repeat-containing protein [Chitinophagaceae bacterium]